MRSFYLGAESGSYLVNHMTEILKINLWGNIKALKIRHQVRSPVWVVTCSFLATYSLSVTTSYNSGIGGIMEILDQPKKKGTSLMDGPN